jgi:polar amino acid transport system substrate-binding protein
MRRSLILCLFAASLLALPALAVATCVRTVRWEPSEPPYNLRLPDGRQGGYSADLVVEVLRRMGCEARLVDMRWPRALVELEAGRLDIMAGMMRTPERDVFARFTRSINLSPNLLYLSGAARQRYPALRTLADLRSTTLTIGVESSAAYGPAFVALQDDPSFRARLYFVPTQRTAWQMLAAGRLDGLISDDVLARIVGLPLQPEGNEVRAVLTVAEAPALIGLSRRSVDAAFAERFDAVLAETVADGWLPRLRERYIGCPTDPVTLGCVEAAGIDAAAPPSE